MAIVTRVYADTSVYGGVFDTEFRRASSRFFQRIKMGHFTLVSSALVRNELHTAPASVREFFDELVSYADLQEEDDKSQSLCNAYLALNVLPESSLTDAMHVALATTASCRIIVSWNFKHIVNHKRIPLFNAVNRLNGYDELAFFSPLEVEFE